MANVTRSSCRQKDVDSNSSKKRQIGGKGSTTSGTPTTYMPGLRRSSRETPSKKQRTSSPSSTRKSERIEKCTSPTPPIKRKSERVEKRTSPTPPIKRKSERVEKRKMLSPSRRSDRGEKHHSLSSSDSKKLEKGSSSLDKKRKKDKRDKSGKQLTTDAGDRSRNGKKDPKPIRVILKKNRVDASNYKTLLKSRTRKTKDSDTSEKLKGKDEFSQRNSDTAGASGSKEVEGDEDGCSKRDGEGVRRLDFEEGCKKAFEESGSGSRKNAERSLKNHGEIELSHSSRKCKTRPEKAHESNHGDRSPASRYNNDSPQSSPDGIMMAKETVVDAGRMQVDCSARVDLQNPELTESTSEGRLLSSEDDLGKAYNVGTQKGKRKTMNSHSDASGMAVRGKLHSSNTDAVSSSTSGSKSNILGMCDGCFKRQRVAFGSQNDDVCFCNSKRARDLCSKSFLEKVSEEAAVFRSPQNEGMLVNCIQKDGAKEDVYLIDRKRGEDVGLDGSELLPEAQRNTMHYQSTSNAKLEIPIPLDEDGVEGEAGFSTGATEECCNVAVLTEYPLDIETETDHNACLICKLGGKLLCCDGKGCKKSYHLYCLDPPLKEVPPGVWHCLWCVKKKIKSGVHSVSGGVESIWDVREVEVSDCEGMQKQKQKQYLVKYRGLAHVHNRWVPESQLLLESPMLVAKLKKNQVLRWKSEWTKPHRLLSKRLLMSPKQYDEYLREHHSDNLNCYYEWFVKWRGLGYENATWELENAPFFRLPEALTLIDDYENRHEKAKRISNPSRADKLLHERKGSLFKLSKFPAISLPGVDNDHPSFVGKICEYWHKGQNAVVIEDQGRFLKVISFILSLQSDVCQPFLIISTSSALSAWEAEFTRLAPSVNVVTYNGNRDVRKSIQSLEFYEEGCIMFEVLLSPPDAIVEDLEVLGCLEWEAIIVDECQHSRISNFFEQIKMLKTDFRLLLVSGPIKDSIPEYLNLLSFIDSSGDGKDIYNLKIDSNDSVGKLKDRFAQFVASERKSDSSKFVEYWVPVQLSNVQLEQYCATLLSNSISLCSCSKNDPVGALRDILISTRKCCDHPYLVDQSLQSSLTKGLPEAEYLEVGVNASGKLQVLDKILSEIKKRGLRVLVLFQSIGGSGRNSIGDILDDFLRQRFGPDSYERVDSVLVASKKQAAMNMFNNKERGRFVFLIENRACLPSIKLSSVDIVILFDSDWNPLNDLRALQKINIDSQFEQLKVFRLYSSLTVEEKVLVLAKQELTLDSNIQNINRGISHTLLIWGASFLFKKLDEFHGSCTPSSGSGISSRWSFLKDVLQEVFAQLPHDPENNATANCSIISKVQHRGATYCLDIFLLGELETQSGNEELPHAFWTNLLKRRCPQWRYLSGPSQRVRKKVQYFDELPKRTEVESSEITKKRKKVVKTTIDSVSLKPSLEDKRKVASMEKQGDSGPPASNFSQTLPRSTSNMNTVDHPKAKDISELPQIHRVESGERRNLRDSQMSLHLYLKPEILEVCKILQLPEDVKRMAGRFLEYIMNNHHVNREPVAILQAFQISLCWSAASLLKHKVNRKESFAHAKQHLKFECKEEEVESVYSKMRVLKKMFSHRAESLMEPNSADPAPRTKEVKNLILDARGLQSTASDQKVFEKDGIRESSQSHNWSSQQVSPRRDKAPDSVKVNGSIKNELSKGIKQVKKIHSKRMRNLLKKQMEEFQEFDKIRNKLLEKGKAKLEQEQKLESALICAVHGKMSIRSDKLKVVEQNFARKMEELNCYVEAQQKKLETMQQEARSEEKRMKAYWLEEAKSGKPVGSFSMLPLSDSGFRVEDMEANEQCGIHDGHEKANPIPVPSEEKDADGIVRVVPDEMVSAEVPKTVPNEAVEVGVPTGLPTLTMQYDGQNDRIDAMVSDRETVTGTKKHSSKTNGSKSRSTPSLEQIQRDSRSTYQHNVSAQDSQVPSCQVPCNEHSQLSMSTGVQAEALPGCEVRNSSRSIEVPPLLPIDAIPSDQSNHGTSVLPPVTQLQLLPSTDPPCAERCQSNISSFVEIEHVQSNEGHGSSQQVQIPIQPPAGDYPDLFNHSVWQPNIQLQLHQPLNSPLVGSGGHFSDPRSMGIVPDSSNRPPQNAPFTSWMSQSLHPDPLQNELARIRREEEQFIKMHEDLKIRLNSECEKEIEEIRKKFNALLQNADTALVQKRKALHSNYNKVYMNRILAEAFKSKCNNGRAGVSSGPHKGAPAGFMQQLFLLSSQQNAQRPAPTPGLTTAPTAASPVHVVHSSALFSSNPVRPHFSPITPTMANQQAGSEIRAPAPHLQPFRLTPSISAASLPTLNNVLPSQQSISNPASILSPHPQLTPRPPSHPSGTFSRKHQAESIGGLPVTSTSLSALELVMDINNRSGADPPNLLPPLHDLGSTLDTWGLSDPMTVNLRDPTAHTGITMDVVCLSDDE